MNTVEIILELLKSQNKKQKELTQFLGISETSVADWKRGKTESYKKHIGKIAEFFGVSTDFLLGGMPEEHTEPKDEDFKIRDVFFVPETLHDKFLIKGSPGVGKSQMAASLTQFNDNAIYIENSHVVKAYKMLTEKEKLEVQIYILEKAAASEKSNAKVEVIEKTE